MSADAVCSKDSNDAFCSPSGLSADADRLGVDAALTPPVDNTRGEEGLLLLLVDTVSVGAEEASLVLCIEKYIMKSYNANPFEFNRFNRSISHRFDCCSCGRRSSCGCRRRRRSGIVIRCQLEVKLSLIAHPVRVGAAVIPGDVDPAIVQLSSDRACSTAQKVRLQPFQKFRSTIGPTFSGRRSILIPPLPVQAPDHPGSDDHVLEDVGPHHAALLAEVGLCLLGGFA